jgi:hypothetical protein
VCSVTAQLEHGPEPTASKSIKWRFERARELQVQHPL